MGKVKKYLRKNAKETLGKHPKLYSTTKKWHAKYITRRNKVVYTPKPINEKLIMIETFYGRNISDTPKRVLDLIIDDPRFYDFEIVVIYKKKNIKNFDDYLDNDRLKFVKFNTKTYLEVVNTAKYLIVNSKIPVKITLKKEQIYMQCWHGTPLKRLGADIVETGRNGQSTTKKSIKKLYLDEGNRVTYFLSPSAYATEKFSTAFCFKELNQMDKLLEVGYPRNDEIFINKDNTQYINELKEKLDIPLDKKVVMYAPTWRDNEYKAGQGYLYDFSFDIEKMRQKLGDEYIFLIRAHYFVSNSLDYEQFGDFVMDMSKVNNVNDLYLVSDILITDYSSVFFDYSILKRPMIFYMYDKEEYATDIRGFYLDLDELPGAIIENEDDLADNILSPKFNEQEVDEFINKFCYLDDGNAGQRLIDIIFKEHLETITPEQIAENEQLLIKDNERRRLQLLLKAEEARLNEEARQAEEQDEALEDEEAEITEEQDQEIEETTKEVEETTETSEEV